MYSLVVGMKLFLDRNKTFLPRIDVIYLLTRVITLLGIIWFGSIDTYWAYDVYPFFAVVVTYTIHLGLFLAAIRRKFDLKLAYFSAIIYDIILIPLLIANTGGLESPLFLAFFLTVSVAAYVLTVWFATAVVVIVTAVYLGALYPQLSVDSFFEVSIRVGFLWVVFIVISYVSDYLRRSEVRLLKLFDTLNMRTSELEKSQAQLEMIYENTRVLASILEPDGVVREIMRIMGDTLQFRHCAVIFRNITGDFYYRARLSGRRVNYHLKAITVEKDGLIRKVCDMHEPIRIKNLAGRDDYEPLKREATSVIIVPMIAHGTTHGLLVAESCDKDSFTDRDVEMLTVVARSAGLALENAVLHKRTEELTIIDDLTGIYNYRYFVQKLQEEKKRAIRYDLPLSIIMVDIDWFKKLNDSYGHEVGNLVLRKLSSVIMQCIRDVDILSRYGGEEFVIILPQTPQIEASRIGERIREQVEQMTVSDAKAGEVSITVSVGATSFPENGKSAEDLVSVADQALYRAKGSGKNLVCVV